MTNNDKNIRTLIICFVVALSILVPLSFIDSGDYSGVLGATTDNQVVLPVTAQIANNCVDRESGELQIQTLKSLLNDNVVNLEVSGLIDKKIKEIEFKFCR